MVHRRDFFVRLCGTPIICPKVSIYMDPRQLSKFSIFKHAIIEVAIILNTIASRKKVLISFISAFTEFQVLICATCPKPGISYKVKYSYTFVEAFAC